AGGVNIEDVKHVGVVEREGKLIHQLLRTGKSVRLKCHDSPPSARSVLRGRKRCKYLRRVMSVIVDHGDAVRLAFELESTIRILESLKCISDLFERDLEFQRHRRGRQCVVDVVLSGHRKVDLAQHLSAFPYGEM